MKYLITGGAGFIGSNIARRLVSAGEQVVILDDFSTGKRENIADLLPKIEVIEGDVCDLDTVRKATKGVDFVLHHAAVVSVSRSIDDPIRTNQVNIEGTLNCLIASKEARVKRFIYAASSSAYGNTPTLPKREDMKPDPTSPYGVSKLTGEMYCKVFNDVFDLPTVSLRYFNIFGPFQDPMSPYAAVIPIFIARMLKGEAPIVYGDGNQSRDFTYIDNAVEANLLALNSKKAPGMVLNVACGKRYTLNHLIEKLCQIMGKKIKAQYVEPRPGDILHSEGDISTARKILGYEPKIDFEEGLRRTVDWFCKKLV